MLTLHRQAPIFTSKGIARRPDLNADIRYWRGTWRLYLYNTPSGSDALHFCFSARRGGGRRGSRADMLTAPRTSRYLGRIPCPPSFRPGLSIADGVRTRVSRPGGADHEELDRFAHRLATERRGVRRGAGRRGLGSKAHKLFVPSLKIRVKAGATKLVSDQCQEDTFSNAKPTNLPSPSPSTETG
jgi:hypothetical protein